MPSPLRLGTRIACLAILSAPALAREPTWTRLDSSHFTIISAVPEKETRAWAVEFEQFRTGIGRFIHTNETALRPVTVVLFRSQDDMRPYKPLEKGRPAEVNGMFLRSQMGNYIEVGADEEDEQTRQLVFHEEVHWLTNVSDTPLPLWLDEGLAEVFSTFSIDDSYYTYGKPLPWHVQLLSREKMIPLKQLLKIRHGSLLYNEGERTSIFYAESWAFVHYLLFSGHWEERTKYNELVRALRGDPDPDALFRRVFGSDCAGMDERLKDYLSHGSYTETRLRYDRTAVEKGFTARTASPAEVKLAEASLLCAVGRPEEALQRLRRIAAAMPESPAGWEAEGFAAYAAHEYGEAATCFGNAAERGSRNYFVYSFLGDTTLGIAPDTLAPQATVGGDLRLADNYYERELSLNPLEQHAYDNLSSNFFALDTLSPADAWILEQGSRLFPDDALIRVGLAVVALKQGRREQGLEALRAVAADPARSGKTAVTCARSILDYQRKSDDIDRLNALLQKQDYPAAVALADEMLKATLEPAERGNLVFTRNRAQVAGEVRKAIDLANSGNVPEARRMLQEVLPRAEDPQMRTQIQVLLDHIAVPRSTG